MCSLVEKSPILSYIDEYVHTWISLFLSLRTPILCHNPNVSAGNMEPEKSFQLLLQAEILRPYPRLEILGALYEQVAEFVSEEGGWTGLPFVRAGC